MSTEPLLRIFNTTRRNNWIMKDSLGIWSMIAIQPRHISWRRGVYDGWYCHSHCDVVVKVMWCDVMWLEWCGVMCCDVDNNSNGFLVLGQSLRKWRRCYDFCRVVIIACCVLIMACCDEITCEMKARDIISTSLSYHKWAGERRGTGLSRVVVMTHSYCYDTVITSDCSATVFSQSNSLASCCFIAVFCSSSCRVSIRTVDTNSFSCGSVEGGDQRACLRGRLRGYVSE